MITTNASASITFDLNPTNTDAVNAMATPQLDIEAGAVYDAAGNQIAAAADQTITVNDTILPTFSSATYATGSGVLTVTFSESLNQTAHDATKIHVRDTGQSSGGVTLSNAMITTNASASITFDLNPTNTDAVNAMATPQLDIEAGAVYDAAGNQIAAAADQTITVNDTIRPAFSSATYLTGSGVLNITFSEELDPSKHIPSKFHVRESGSDTGGVTLSNGTITANGTKSLTFTFSSADQDSVNDMGAIQLDIDAGAVSDAAGNAIADAVDQVIVRYDTTPPTYKSATFVTGSGVLNVTFSETLNQYAHNTSKIHVRTIHQSSGGVTLSNTMIAANGTNFITLNLSEADTTMVNAMATPQLDIEEGAVYDTAGNPVPDTHNRDITVRDTIPPTLTSATYLTGNGTLKMAFSEAISAADASKIHIRSVSHNSGGITLSAVAITGDTLNTTLSDAQQNEFDSMATPQLDIEPGAVRDASNNPIPAVSDQTITVLDTKPPEFASATYNTASGVTTIEFSEALDVAAHDASKIHIRNASQGTGGVTLSNGVITTNSTDSITFDLNNTDTSKVNAMATPQIDIERGAVRDASGNLIAATSDMPLSVTTPAPAPAPAPAPSSQPFLPAFAPPPPPPPPALLIVHDDAIPPEIVSARVSASVLHVTFDEPVTASDWSGFTLRSGPDTLNLTGSPDDGARHMAAKIGGVLSGNITLSVAEGAVLDMSGNPNPEYDNLPLGLAAPRVPVVESASYTNSTGILSIRFDQIVAPGNVSKIAITDRPLDAPELLSTAGGITLHFRMDLTPPDALGGAVHVRTGSILDGNGTAYEVNQTVPLLLPEASLEPPRAVYNAATGAVWLHMDAENISLNGSAITVRNSTTQVKLSDMHALLNGVVEYSGNSTMSPDNSTALYMDIPAGAIRADSGTVPAAGNHTVDVFHRLNTTAAYSFPTGNVTTSVHLMPPGLVVAVAPDRISIFDMADTPNRAASVPLNFTILDASPMRDTGHLAVLAESAVLLLDLADPASPEWSGALSFADNASRGTITPMALDGIPHLASVTQSGMALILAWDPANPKVVMGASMPSEPSGAFGSASPGSGVLYTSLAPGKICAVNMTSNHEVSCETHAGTPRGMDAIVAGGVLYLASTADTPGVSVRDMSLNETLFVDTDRDPLDVAMVEMYGTAYAVAAAGDLYSFDMSGEPVYVEDGLYVSLDAARLGGSTYMVLLDTYGMAHVVDLAAP